MLAVYGLLDVIFLTLKDAIRIVLLEDDWVETGRAAEMDVCKLDGGKALLILVSALTLLLGLGIKKTVFSAVELLDHCRVCFELLVL